MFSIIIPTMQKNIKILNKLIAELVEDSAVGEVIIIDNSCIGFEYSSPKVRVITPSENLFVNPSWNLGIKESKYKIWGILNDDILLPEEFCSNIMKLFVTRNCGLIGLESYIYQATDEKEFDSYPIAKNYSLKKIKNRLNIGFWGAGFFGKKEDYYEIPEEMKILGGDNYLLMKNEQNNKNNYQITGIEVKHLVSQTSSCKCFDEIKEADQNYYKSIDKSFALIYKKDKKTLLKKVFSITNEYENEYDKQGKYKVICILGYKIKIKKKVKYEL